MIEATTSEPDGAPRIASLDVLRGVAILGILFMNIGSMGSTIAASHGPLPALAGWSSADQLFWWARSLLAQGTARGLLELLFGGGMVILTGRLAAGRSRWSAVARYYWRNIVLAIFGLVHVWLLLWPGDILHIYALSALVAFPLRRLPARWLLVLGLTYGLFNVVMAGRGLSGAIHDNAVSAQARVAQAQGRSLTAAQREAVAGVDKWHQQLAKTRADHAKELIERRSGYIGWARVLRGEWISRYTSGWWGPLRAYWEVVAAMLLGAGLFKLGILQGNRSRRFYLRLTAGSYAVGLTIRAVATYFTARQDDTVTLAWALDEYARLAVTLGHVGLIHLVLQSRHARVLAPFAAAGRTALTLYILQSLICLWLLYPPIAFAWFGTQGWAGMMLAALAVDAALLAGAVWWVRRYPIAPVEWAWRSLAGLRPLPFRRTVAIS